MTGPLREGNNRASAAWLFKERDMNRNIWVISDTHFNHSNILTFKDSVGKPTRNFSDVNEMNECMLDNWNDTVNPGDIVYHLGDVLFGYDKQEWMEKNFAKLPGRKRLVVGNHDNIKMLAPFFKKVTLWRHLLLENMPHGLLFTHTPAHPTTLGEKDRFGENNLINVHGHIHQNASPNGPYKCVCVEQTDYKPVHIDELVVK